MSSIFSKLPDVGMFQGNHSISKYTITKVATLTSFIFTKYLNFKKCPWGPNN